MNRPGRELWAGREGSLAGLSSLAGRVVDAALVTGGDAYLAMAPPYQPVGAGAALPPGYVPPRSKD